MKNTPGESVPQSLHRSTDVSSVQGDQRSLAPDGQNDYYAPYPAYSSIYITKRYRCGCSTIVPMLRSAYERDYPLHAREGNRDIQDDTHNCPACNESAMRAIERRMERQVAG